MTAAAPVDLARSTGQWLAGWWRMLHLATLLLVMALSPSSYAQENRRALLRHLYLGTAPALPWFTVLITLISVVVTRIVLVTAVSYGVSQFALEMVVRVLVLELIPLSAALFAALRCTFPNAAEIAFERVQGDHVQLLRTEVLPRVAAGVFCALMLAAVSCVVTFAVAYLSVYGLTASGFAAYTRTVGHVFNPGVAMIFGLKILFLGITVALVPVATVLEVPRRHARTSAELQGLVRMFLLILLIEVAALIGNYS